MQSFQSNLLSHHSAREGSYLTSYADGPKGIVACQYFFQHKLVLPTVAEIVFI